MKWTKEVSSHQPYERKEPVHFVKLQYFCVHLQMWTAEVAAALAEPTKVVYSRWLFPSSYTVQVLCFFFFLIFKADIIRFLQKAQLIQLLLFDYMYPHTLFTREWGLQLT